MKSIYRGLMRAGNKVVLPLDRILNRLHTSTYNPLYRSGTIAVVSLLMAFASGIYLIFFYRLGDPYASMERLHESVWLGSWVRSFHRYASAVTLAAAVVHGARMFLQGKSWGRRVLAWISGVLLLGMILLSGWSGYILVWDGQAQAIILGFASIIDSTGLFPEPMSYSFNGQSPRPMPSFFFLFLFLHVVVPLAIVFGLWIHTSRLARSVWLPNRAMIVAVIVLTSIAAVVWPVLLESEANLLKLPGHHGTDILYNFWIDAAFTHPRLVLAAGVAIFLSLVVLPFTIRPAKKDRPTPSFNDPEICVGCRQCAEDCPYEAIQMIPRPNDPDHRLSPLLAVVNDNRCVSCGACAASCPVHTMGPAGRKGPDQLAALDSFLAGLPDHDVPRDRMTVLLSCSNQPGSQRRYNAWAAEHPDVCVYPTGCGGTVHPHVLEKLAGHFGRVLIAACPPRNCVTKDGFLLLSERVNGERTPPRFSDSEVKERIHIIPAGDGEESRVFARIASTVRKSSSRPGKARSLAAGALLVALIAGASRIPPQSTTPETGIIRLNWRLTGQREMTVNERTPEELNALPRHMRAPFTITTKPVPYQLSARVNEETVIDRIVEAGGVRQDGPLFVAEDIESAPGTYTLDVAFTPRDYRHTNAPSLTFEGSITVRAGGITLIHYQQQNRTLVMKQENPQP